MILQHMQARTRTYGSGSRALGGGDRAGWRRYAATISYLSPHCCRPARAAQLTRSLLSFYHKQKYYCPMVGAINIFTQVVKHSEYNIKVTKTNIAIITRERVPDLLLLCMCSYSMHKRQVPSHSYAPSSLPVRAWSPRIHRRRALLKLAAHQDGPWRQIAFEA